MHRLFSYRPCKPRNPLLRLLIGFVGLILLILFVVFGLFAGIVMLLYTAVRRMTRPQSQTNAISSASMHDINTIDGEYSVVKKSQPTLHLH